MDSTDNAEETILNSSDEDKDNQVPFNAELGEYNEDVESACKAGDAIGNTLYSKSWLLEFFLTLSNSRNIDILEKRFMALQFHKPQDTGVGKDEEEGDPERILSDFDSLVAMSADKTVAEYLIDEQGGCLGMLTAEILPIQINEEHKYFSDIRSHFWRRQELCLVTLSNIVVHNSVLKTMILAINDSNHDKSYDNQNVLMQIVHLSFSCVLFGDNFGLQAEFTSVLVACFQFLRNLAFSLNVLITENQGNLLNSNEELTEGDKQTLTGDLEIAYSNPPLYENDSPVSKQDSDGNSPETIDASKINIESNKLDNTLQCIAKEILSLFSQPEVVQMTGMMLASSCNEDLLNKMSRLLIVLLELSSDLEYEGLIECYYQLGFLSCVKEALKQTFTISRDVKTAFVFIDFLGEILNQMKDAGNQGLKSILLDQHGQRDETFPTELSDILTDITVEMNDLQHCAMISKILSVLWHPSIMTKHSSSFEKVATFIINVDKENGNIENLDLDDQVSYFAIIESLSIFLQNFSVMDSNKEEMTNIETRITQLIRKEKHQQGQGLQADPDVTN